jgi:hypothetical protein
MVARTPVMVNCEVTNARNDNVSVRLRVGDCTEILIAFVKLAVSVRLLVAINVYCGLVEITAPPSVQFVNAYPELGAAVTVTLVPDATLPPPDVVPPVEGLEAVDMITLTATGVVGASPMHVAVDSANTTFSQRLGI